MLPIRIFQPYLNWSSYGGIWGAQFSKYLHYAHGMVLHDLPGGQYPLCFLDIGIMNIESVLHPLVYINHFKITMGSVKFTFSKQVDGQKDTTRYIICQLHDQ